MKKQVVHYGAKYIRHQCEDYTEGLLKRYNSGYVKDYLPNGMGITKYSSPMPIQKTDIEKVNCKKCLGWGCDTSLEVLSFE